MPFSSKFLSMSLLMMTFSISPGASLGRFLLMSVSPLYVTTTLAFLRTSPTLKKSLTSSSSRYDVAHAVDASGLDVFLLFVSAVLYVSCCALAGRLALKGNEVNKIVNMQHIAAGENAGVSSLSVFVDYRAAGDAVKFDTHVLAQLVLGDKTDGKHERVAGDIFLRAGNWLQMLVYIGNGNTLKTVLAVSADNRAGKAKRNTEVLKALNDISRKSARIRHKLANSLNLRAL